MLSATKNEQGALPACDEPGAGILIAVAETATAGW
jgi:hypothetical protein